MRFYRHCALALASLMLLSEAAEAQVEELLNQGVGLMESGDYAAALNTLDRAKRAAPNDPRPYFFTGVTLDRTNQLFQAVRELEKAVQLDPSEPKYSLAWAESLLKMGNVVQATTALESLKKENTSFDGLPPEEMWLLSDLFFRTGLYDDSLSILELYAARNPDEERVYFRRAELYLSHNDLDSALVHFQQALERSSRKPAASYGIGLVMMKMGRLEEAREALVFSAEAEPGNPEVVHLLGTVLIALGEPEEALQRLLRVEGLGEEFPKLYDAIARAHRSLGHAEKAREYGERFRLVDSTRREQRRAQLALGRAQDLLRERKLDEALQGLEDVLKIDPDNFMAHSYLVGLHMTARNWERARHHLSRAQAIDPTCFETQYMTASYLHERKQMTEALQYAQQARELQPGHAELRNLLGNIYYSLGDLQSALEEYAAAMKLDPERSDFRANYEVTARSLRIRR